MLSSIIGQDIVHSIGSDERRIGKIIHFITHNLECEIETDDIEDTDRFIIVPLKHVSSRIFQPSCVNFLKMSGAVFEYSGDDVYVMIRRSRRVQLMYKIGLLFQVSGIICLIIGLMQGLFNIVVLRHM